MNFKDGDLVDFHVIRPGSTETGFLARGTVTGNNPALGAALVHVDYYVYHGCMRIVNETWYVEWARLIVTPRDNRLKPEV